MNTEIERLVSGATPGPSFVERLAERMTPTSSRAVFSEPVERDGVTVIGVAKARWGFGGGGGSDDEKGSKGSGGGGASAAPLGYITIRQGEATFQPIKDPAALIWVVPLILAGGINAWLVLRGVRALFR